MEGVKVLSTYSYCNVNIKTLFISMKRLFYYCIFNVYGMIQEFIFITMNNYS